MTTPAGGTNRIEGLDTSEVARVRSMLSSRRTRGALYQIMACRAVARAARREKEPWSVLLARVVAFFIPGPGNFPG